MTKKYQLAKSLIMEYGYKWFFHRTLYSLKIFALNKNSKLELILDKKTKKNKEQLQINLIDLDIEGIKGHLDSCDIKTKKEIVRLAENAIDGKILAFSHLNLDYGSPINWNLNPVTNQFINYEKWYRIKDFNSRSGDIKLVWEISRFTHLFYFMRAYLLTNDKKFYAAFSSQVQEWIDSNEFSYGPNYKCGQESSFRMINIIIGYNFFNQFNLTSEQDRRNVEKIVLDSHNKIINNFSYAKNCIKNNHTISEITGLIIGSYVLGNEKEMKKNCELLNKEIDNQFFDDGGYIQYSFNYQRLVFQIILFNLKISPKTNFTLTKNNTKKINNSLKMMRDFLVKDSFLPNYGSNDGALLFPVSSVDYSNYSPQINALWNYLNDTNLFDISEMNDKNYLEESIWFSKANHLLDNAEYNAKKNKRYDNYGLYKLSHDFGYSMIVLQNFESRPAQMDQLHLDLWHRGENLLCDSGSFSYASSLGLELASTKGHNTVQVGELDQMERRPPFFIYNWTEKKDVKLDNNYFRGSFHSKNGYFHQREIFIHQNKHLITDSIKLNTDTKIGELSVVFNIPNPLKIINNEVHIFSINNSSKIIAKIKSNGNLKLEKSFRSKYYFKKEEINKLFIVHPLLEKNEFEVSTVIELL